MSGPEVTVGLKPEIKDMVIDEMTCLIQLRVLDPAKHELNGGGKSAGPLAQAVAQGLKQDLVLQYNFK